MFVEPEKRFVLARRPNKAEIFREMELAASNPLDAYSGGRKIR
jgi:hypothetical protein